MKEDAHDKEVQQEALGGVWTVEVEKDKCEEQREELEARVAEGRAQQLQSSNGGQQDVAAGGRSNRSKGVSQAVNHAHTYTHSCEGDAKHAALPSVCVHLLDSQLLAVAECKAVISERAQHDGRVHHVFLEAQQANVEPLEPHQHCIL